MVAVGEGDAGSEGEEGDEQEESESGRSGNGESGDEDSDGGYEELPDAGDDWQTDWTAVARDWTDVMGQSTLRGQWKFR